ncbi:putative reverse transcriptase domain-containing protein, partial [Tanacetum coccineum]
FLSDHRPILLRESNHDYGPILFKYFNHWMELYGFNKFVIDTWNSTPVETNAMRNVMQKFKFLKVMSFASSAVTYTSVYTDSEPGRVFWGADEEISDGGVPRVIVYGYDRLPMKPVDPPSPDYVPGPEHPPSPDYVPSPEHPPSPIEIPYVPEPEYPEYLVPSEDEAPMEDQPLPVDASPAALSQLMGWSDEPYGDDTVMIDRYDDEEEPFEDEEDDEDEEEHLAPADSPVIPVVNPVPSAGDIMGLEMMRLQRIARDAAALLHQQYLLLSHQYPYIPFILDPLLLPGAPLGYRAAGIRMRVAVASPPSLLPPTSPRTDVLEAKMPPWKRACLTTPAPGYEIGESSAAGAARQPRPTPEVDTWDEIVEAVMEIAPTTLDRPHHRRTALAMDREAVYAGIAWTSYEERSAAIEAHVRTLEAQAKDPEPRMDQLRLQKQLVSIISIIVWRVAKYYGVDPQLKHRLYKVGRGGRRGRGHRGGNDECVDELNGQGNDQGMRANGGVEGVNGNVEGVNGGAPNFSTIIAQQLQNLLPAMLAQDGNQGNVGNQNGNVVNENVQENVGNVIVNGNQVGCSYKEFLACNPKEYDGNRVKYTAGLFVGKALTWWNSQIRTLSREVVVSMSWNDFKFMMIEEFCPSHEMQKLESELWNHAMVGAGHAAYTDRFHELARLVPHLVTPKSRMIERYVYGLAPQIRRMVAATEPKTIQKVVQISGALTDEAVRNGSIKKVEKRGNMGEPSKDKNGRDDNKRTRTGNAFATIANPVGRENTGTWPKCTTCNSYHAPGGPCRTYFNCNRPSHLANDCRGVPRNVNHVDSRNPTVRACYECGSTDHVRGRAFMFGAEKARLDPNIVTGTFTLNNHFATTLFDSGADYSFVSTTFIPMLGLEPSDLGFRYEIEIASGQLVEIDKVIKGCKLEIEDHVFDIDLIPFGYRKFDAIIGMDWLSNYKAKIICHESVVRIPLPDGKVLRVVGERLNEKVRFFIGVNKQEEIIMVRDFPKVFPDDLSGLLPIRKIEFRIELILGATPVAMSPYHLV